jgi:hypothetical protein
MKFEHKFVEVGKNAHLEEPIDTSNIRDLVSEYLQRKTNVARNKCGEAHYQLALSSARLQEGIARTIVLENVDYPRFSSCASRRMQVQEAMNSIWGFYTDKVREVARSAGITDRAVPRVANEQVARLSSGIRSLTAAAFLAHGAGWRIRIPSEHVDVDNQIDLFIVSGGQTIPIQVKSVPSDEVLRQVGTTVNGTSILQVTSAERKLFKNRLIGVPHTSYIEEFVAIYRPEAQSTPPRRRTR